MNCLSFRPHANIVQDAFELFVGRFGAAPVFDYGIKFFIRKEFVVDLMLVASVAVITHH